MLTYESVQEIFNEYLSEDEMIEVVNVRGRYTVLTWDKVEQNWIDAEYCGTPEDLFDSILDSYQGYQQYLLSDNQHELTQEDEELIWAMSQPYLEARKREEEG